MNASIQIGTTKVAPLFKKKDLNDLSESSIDRAYRKVWARRGGQRERILDLLKEHRELTVTEIYIRIRDKSQPSISAELAILKKAGLVRAKRSGKFMKYSIIKTELNRVELLIRKLATNGAN